MQIPLQTIGRPGEPSPAPFTRAQLANGLRVVVRPNRTLPIVAIDCWLAVGALAETDEHAGISHFLEHMFFKGTRRFPLGTMDRMVKEMGGYNNAATSMEYTHYYIVAPSEHFSLALDILADHLSDPTLPADELERERQVVKEEIRRKDDTPSGRLFTLLQTTAFGATPYAREILGTPESLDRIDRDVMAAYWRAHYTADRLVVVVAGDVDPEEATAAVAVRLADVPEGSGAAAAPALPPPVQAVERETMDVSQSYLALAYATAGRRDMDEMCALEIGSSILGDGMTSRLYRRLVDKLRLVTMVSSWTYGLGDTGLLGIDAICSPARRDAVESEIAAILDAAVRDGVTESEVRRAQAMLAADFAYDNETNASLTGTLGEFEVLYGDAQRYRDVLSGLARVTPDEVGEALARRIRPDLGVRVSVGPHAA